MSVNNTSGKFVEITLATVRRRLYFLWLRGVGEEVSQAVGEPHKWHPNSGEQKRVLSGVLPLNFLYSPLNRSRWWMSSTAIYVYVCASVLWMWESFLAGVFSCTTVLWSGVRRHGVRNNVRGRGLEPGSREWAALLTIRRKILVFSLRKNRTVWIFMVSPDLSEPHYWQ